MRPELLAMAAELSRREEPYVLAVVTWRRPPSSAQTGDTALITADGGFHGWLGGACTRPTVEREARAALADGRPRLVALDPDPGAGPARPGVDVRPMTCHSGGSVEIYLDPILPAPRLVVYGESPAARALAALAGTLGYGVTQVPASGAGEPGAAAGRRPLYAVVATMGEADEESIRAALELGPDYLGLVASPRRFAEIRRTLVAGGVAEEALDRVTSPAGLSIGARTPEEIALSVLAEIVQVRAAAAEAPRDEAGGEAAEEPAAAPATAVDPICGMTVEIAGARHTAEHAGRSFYFCCGGCRERFLAEPERYLAAEGTG